MIRNNRLNARCTAAEKEMWVEVARAMQRTPSDALRILVHEKAQLLDIPRPNVTTTQLPLVIQEVDV